MADGLAICLWPAGWLVTDLQKRKEQGVDGAQMFFDFCYFDQSQEEFYLFVMYR